MKPGQYVIYTKIKHEIFEIATVEGEIVKLHGLAMKVSTDELRVPSLEEKVEYLLRKEMELEKDKIYG